MREQPYQVINTATDETIAWCTYTEYATIYAGKSGIDVIYRPGRKKKVKK
jgi:hypothetical protein